MKEKVTNFDYLITHVKTKKTRRERLKIFKGYYRTFSHDVTAAILVYKTMKRRPYWRSQKMVWGLNSFKTLFCSEKFT